MSTNLGSVSQQPVSVAVPLIVTVSNVYGQQANATTTLDEINIFQYGLNGTVHSNMLPTHCHPCGIQESPFRLLETSVQEQFSYVLSRTSRPRSAEASLEHGVLYGEYKVTNLSSFQR